MTINIKQKPIIWTISGSDCSGGAGIAADIKTGHSLGVQVCTLITANTVQNSTTLVSVNPVAVDILQQQVDALVRDKPPSVIKIGLLATLAQVHWLAQCLVQLKQLLAPFIVVYDPVGQASAGGHFHQLAAHELAPLLHHIDVLTPNINEATFLTSSYTSAIHPADIAELAEKIYHLFPINTIVIKGGHSHDPQCIDICYHQLNQMKQDNAEKTLRSIRYQLSSPRLYSHYSHGGGCSFASAFSAFLAQGYLVRDAFVLTKSFINLGLAATQQLSSSQAHDYYGAFEQLPWQVNINGKSAQENKIFPTVVDDLHQTYQHLSAFKSLNLKGEKLGLYPVIDSIDWLKRLLPLGLHIIQLRIKNLSQVALELIIEEAVSLAKKYNTRLFINDYWQLAIKYGAYGVHIGQEDLGASDLNKIHQAGIRLGISTHGWYEFLLAQQLQPSYLAIGAIFPTQTKDMTGQIQGLENLQQLVTLSAQYPEHNIPIVAIGGINLARVAQVLATGVNSIGVVTAITKAEHPIRAVADLTALINATN